jgi:hypothetical protein
MLTRGQRAAKGAEWLNLRHDILKCRIGFAFVF